MYDKEQFFIEEEEFCFDKTQVPRDLHNEMLNSIQSVTRNEQFRNTPQKLIPVTIIQFCG